MSMIDPGAGHLITKDIHHEHDRPRGGAFDYKRYSSMSMIDPGVGHLTTKDIHHELDRPRGGTLDYKRYSS